MRCLVCDTPIQTGRRFCSLGCLNKCTNEERRRAFLCLACGKEFRRKIGGNEFKRQGLPKYCSQQCAKARYVRRGVILGPAKPRERTCLSCDEIFWQPSGRGRNALRCVDCRRKQRRRREHVRRRLLAGRPGSFTLEQIAQRDNHRCYLCGRRVSVRNATLDHIIPLAMGGRDSEDNVALAHRSCNSKKWASLPPSRKKQIPGQFTFRHVYVTQRGGAAP